MQLTTVELRKQALDSLPTYLVKGKWDKSTLFTTHHCALGWLRVVANRTGSQVLKCDEAHLSKLYGVPNNELSGVYRVNDCSPLLLRHKRVLEFLEKLFRDNPVVSEETVNT